MKNPQAGSPPSVGLEKDRKAEFPNRERRETATSSENRGGGALSRKGGREAGRGSG